MSEAEELQKRRAEEYQMQLFGTHSRSVFAAINQKIKENVDSRCQKLYESMVKKCNFNDEEKEILKNSIKQLMKTYRRNMKPNVLKIKNTVDKFICIPNNVLLEEDKCQAIQYTDAEYQELEKNLLDLQNEVKRVTIFNAALKEELEAYEKIKESEDLANKLCCLIDKKLAAKKTNHKIVRTVNNCKGLKELLDSVKTQSQNDIYNPSIPNSELDQIFLSK